MVVFLIGCQPNGYEGPGGDCMEKKITIQIHSPSTRSFDSSIAETWEKKVNTATIYVFNSTGKTVLAYTLKSSEITALNASTSSVLSMLVPGNLTVCDIYMVANTTPSASITTKASFLTSYEQDIKSYNGVYGDVTTKALRANGFVMTGKQDGVILNASQAVNVGLTLRRIVAKLAIDISFTAVLNLGSITLDSVWIEKSAPYSNLFPLTTGNTAGNAVTFTQIPQPNGTKKYRAFFYIYENDARTSANAATINLSGKGSLLLVSTPFKYRLPINGDVVNQQPTYKISRNTPYYVNINITKLTTILLLNEMENRFTYRVNQKIGNEEVGW